MGTTNLVILIVGFIVLLFGIGTFLNPNLARWINAPGGPKTKAIVALITGLILIIIGFIMNLT